MEEVRVGKKVPNFEMEVYDPKTGSFGKVSLEDQASTPQTTKGTAPSTYVLRLSTILA